MRLVQSVKGVFAATSLVFMILGLCLLLWPDLSALTICVLLGVICMVHGIVRLVGYFANDLYRLAFQFDLAVGILSILIGCVLVFHPRHILALLPVVLGLFILADSALRIQTALDARRFGMSKWWAILLVAIGGVVLGTVLLFSPFEGTRALVRLMGLTLLIDGGECLLTCLYTVKPPRNGPRWEDETLL
jgi:uncharacterized membrane protein HdeD (DUF308 family)